MSAETPRRSRSASGTTTSGPAVASPQHVNDRSIIDSVAGFINEVVPTAYSTPVDTKDQIQWLHFEYIDKAQAENIDGIDCGNGIPPPLIAVLGYGTGIQVWAIPANGDAVEVLSWRHGQVRVLRILTNPASNLYGDKPDLYSDKRPLMVLCDTATPGPQYYSLSFISLKTGTQVKNIKFKNPVLDVLANKRSVVITFSERIAIFDALTLEDRLTVTTCYLSPGLYPNPVALGTRWLAYAEKKLIPARRSGGGNEGEGVQSYTATVLHAAKSLGKGLRELGETVASSLSGSSSISNAQHIIQGASTDMLQPGVVTILDLQGADCGNNDRGFPVESVVAHFTAHSEAIVCLQFDPSGMLLLTADKRGHDFHLFRIQPHPGGPSLAAVHHLYTLHRGDTSARVQDMCFSPDSRWIAVSTLRGTTHVFPVTPYGGPVGMRTHATPHVVNRMSRFHRSAGLPVESGRSNSPVSQIELPIQAGIPYRNPRLPPYPHPTVVHPLAQLRQPVLQPISGSGITQRSTTGRTRLGSSSEDSAHVALRVAACFAPPRAWLDQVNQSRESSHKQRRPVESLFVISCHGTLLQYDLEPRHSISIPKEKVCDDTPVELKVIAKAQWTLQRQPNSTDIQAPLSSENLLLCMSEDVPKSRDIKADYSEDRWLSQVEIITHAGPHRRLWMGPQFTFKTYNGSNGSPVSVLETDVSDVTSVIRPARSNPLNMPDESVPVLIESGSASSFEQSPRLLDREIPGSSGESQLREDLADAMLESPGRTTRDEGGRCVLVSVKHNAHIVAKVVNPLGTVVTVPNDDQVGSGEEAQDEAVIHENCDEALFRPVVGARPIICLKSDELQKEEPPKRNNLKDNNKQRYQGLKFDEIVHNEEPVEKPTGKKNRKSKQKNNISEKKDEPLIKDVCPPIVIKEDVKDDMKEMWSSIEKVLPESVEHIMKDVMEEDVPKEMWSSLEHCKMDESTYVEMTSNTYDVDEIPALLDKEFTPPDENFFMKNDLKVEEDVNVNNNSSETTESDDSAKNKILVSVADTAEDNTATMPALETQSNVKTSKKKTKKKRK